MFKNCYSLEKIDMSNFETDSLIYMNSMFHSCAKLTSLNLNRFNTSLVTDMSYLFYNCSSLEHLIINFKTERVQNMNYMFGGCTKLNSLDISTFNTINCKSFTNMFENDTNLHLYLNFDNTKNLRETLPNYINIHNSTENS